ncbi:hypothetical protein ABE504_23190 [Paenibacillus oryzisoli]|nr:hypothetical protein [Paenibacillus whitsoniae]
MTKRKPQAIARNKQANNEINKKAIIWTSAIVVVIIVAMSLLIILDKS